MTGGGEIALEVQGLHAYYGESHVLHGIDIQVRRGELVTLLGRNGAGRTSTIRSIMGLVGYSEGGFDTGAGEERQGRLARRLHQAAAGGRGVAAGGDAWREAVAGWLQEAGNEPSA